MSKNEIYLLILGMALVTYLPRAIPVFLPEKFAASGRIKKFFVILGGITAALLALKRYPLVICVLGAVVVNYILYLI